MKYSVAMHWDAIETEKNELCETTELISKL